LLNNLPVETQQKWANLLEILQSMDHVLVALSGGVDSSLLCVAAKNALGDQSAAITIASQVEVPGETDFARSVAQQVDIRHFIVAWDDLSIPAFAANDPMRCYYCKLNRLGYAVTFARENDLGVVVDGSNVDDAQDYRPGRKALQELGIRSPLAEAGLTKSDIRRLAQTLSLTVWDRPSAPCLATRFPYGTPITETGLHQVAEAEIFLKDLGFKIFRVRHHGETARIEVAQQEINSLIEQRIQVVDKLKSLGFHYVSLDLEGYRTGSMNEVIKQ